MKYFLIEKKKKLCISLLYFFRAVNRMSSAMAKDDKDEYDDKNVNSNNQFMVMFNYSLLKLFKEISLIVITI